MIARVCLGTRGQPCGRLVSASVRRCEACAKAHDAERNADRRRSLGTTAQRGYGRPWRVKSERYRRNHPTCELRYPGCAFYAVDTDHVRPIRAGGTSDPDNLAAVCRPCHRIKTLEDQGRYPE